LSRYIGEFKLSKGENLLYYYEDGPYLDVLDYLKELTGAEPKYVRSVRAWTVPLSKWNKKTLTKRVEEKDWSCDIL
jgi:hypothetical protein